MNNTIIPAKTICSHCQNIGLIDADYCVSCGVSFVFGKPDAWSTKPYKTKDTSEIEFERLLDSFGTIMSTSFNRKEQPCLWDTVPRNSVAMGLSCSCPKCSVSC